MSQYLFKQGDVLPLPYFAGSVAGDGRASEQPALTALHTIFMREHNRLVDGLHVMNPHWDDERLYQHGRRILTAVTQHITYNEFLPRILGWNAINLYELKLRPQGYYKGECRQRDRQTYSSRFGKCNVVILTRGMLWRSWLRLCATSEKDTGLTPVGVIGIFRGLNP